MRSAVTVSGPRRRRPLLIRQWPMILVLLVLAAAPALVLIDADFQRGSVAFAAAVCLAALLRAVLPNGWAGLLRVRSRWLDFTTLLLFGVGSLLASLALIYEWDADLAARWLQDVL